MMETLDDTNWDVVISGTGFSQSLLALALSRSNYKILHVDRNGYYGSNEAALSLSEAEAWAKEHLGQISSPFSNVNITKTALSDESGTSKLLSSRAYSLALAPHLVYAQAALIQAFVSSHIHNQLEFQAVGSWFILNPLAEASSGDSKLTRVPGGREDIFRDDALDLKEKRSLMKFLRFVGNHDDQPDTWQDSRSTPFTQFLQQRFNLPSASHAPILALTMEVDPPARTSVETALASTSRHLRSIGVFGPGFGAVLPKWGGLAEIGQVACRACAVGGGVYVLGTGVQHVQPSSNDDIALTLSNDNNVKTKWLVGSTWDLPDRTTVSQENSATGMLISKSISIVSSPLTHLFPPTSEGGVTPAGAVIFVPSANEDDPPIYILVHSSEAGECPTGQSVLYASIAQSSDTGFERLSNAVSDLLQTSDEETSPQVLWNMSYEQRFPTETAVSPEKDFTNANVVVLPSLSPGLALDDSVMENVKDAWLRITSANDETFMKFEARENVFDDTEDGE